MRALAAKMRTPNDLTPLDRVRWRGKPFPGFTLTELLVAISIMLLIGSLGLSAYINAQRQQRISVLTDKVRLALELAKDMAVSNNAIYEFKVSVPNQAGSQALISAGYPSWQASNLYAYNAIIHPLVDNGCMYQCATSGLSGTTEPTWPITVGTQGIDDGSVTWTCEIDHKAISLLIDKGFTITTNLLPTAIPAPPPAPPSTTAEFISTLAFNPDGSISQAQPVTFFISDGSPNPVQGVNTKMIEVYVGGMIKMMLYNSKTLSWY
jgi:prepilin-type N-terminal cleavage/methylation domain-containing protein